MVETIDERRWKALAKVEQDIAESERRIRIQIALIARLETEGADTSEAREVLLVLEGGLGQECVRKAALAKAIEERC